MAFSVLTPLPEALANVEEKGTCFMIYGIFSKCQHPNTARDVLGKYCETFHHGVMDF